jgi:ParB-like chromosome segregation protein Spo0J
MKRKEVLISKLLVDQQNPRLSESQDTQRDAIRGLASLQGKKLIVLAEHIVEYGINLADLPIIMESEENSDRYIVLDGNRRITTARALETPDLVDGAISKSDFKKLKKLSKEYIENPIEVLWAVEVSSRDEADPWITLRHRGQSGGAGLVEWDGDAGARYDKRRGETTPHLDILNFVKESGQLSSDEVAKLSSFPITTLGRIVKDLDVRSNIGIDIRKGVVYSRYPDDEVLKSLSKIVKDIATGDITVTDLKKKEDRLKYIGKFSQEHLPDPSEVRQLKELSENRDNDQDQEEEQNSKKKRKKRKPKYDRETLIPKDCHLFISEDRIEDVYLELQAINPEVYNNISAIMLRVFVEWSIDDYIDKNNLKRNLTNSQQRELHKRVIFLLDHMEENGIFLEKNEIKPIKVEANNVDSLIAMNTLNAYVHNTKFFPKPSELLKTWDRLEPLMLQIWDQKS